MNRVGFFVVMVEVVMGVLGNIFVVCFDIWCLGKVYDKDKSVRNDGMVEEWMYVLVIFLIGSCYLLKNNLLK